MGMQHQKNIFDIFWSSFLHGLGSTRWGTGSDSIREALLQRIPVGTFSTRILALAPSFIRILFVTKKNKESWCICFKWQYGQLQTYVMRTYSKDVEENSIKISNKKKYSEVYGSWMVIAMRQQEKAVNTYGKNHVLQIPHKVLSKFKYWHLTSLNVAVWNFPLQLERFINYWYQYILCSLSSV